MKAELDKYKMHLDRVKELTGVEADLYVFTKSQLEELMQNTLSKERVMEKEELRAYYLETEKRQPTRTDDILWDIVYNQNYAKWLENKVYSLSVVDITQASEEEMLDAFLGYSTGSDLLGESVLSFNEFKLALQSLDLKWGADTCDCKKPIVDPPKPHRIRKVQKCGKCKKPLKNKFQY